MIPMNFNEMQSIVAQYAWDSGPLSLNSLGRTLGTGGGGERGGGGGGGGAGAQSVPIKKCKSSTSQEYHNHIIHSSVPK